MCNILKAIDDILTNNRNFDESEKLHGILKPEYELIKALSCDTRSSGLRRKFRLSLGRNSSHRKFMNRHSSHRHRHSNSRHRHSNSRYSNKNTNYTNASPNYPINTPNLYTLLNPALRQPNNCNMPYKQNTWYQMPPNYSNQYIQPNYGCGEITPIKQRLCPINCKCCC